MDAKTTQAQDNRVNLRFNKLFTCKLHTYWLIAENTIYAKFGSFRPINREYLRMKFEWEEIPSNQHGHYVTYRAQVIGGWLVYHDALSDYAPMVFIPDPTYAWVIDEPEKRPEE